MHTQRGSALILALLLLIFLMVLGSALLTSVTLDVAIGENYRSETQLLYLAEAGIEEARVLLQNSPETPSQLLTDAAAADGVLSTSRDLDTLLNGTDDIPLLSGGNRSTGKVRLDTSGQPAGRYFVFLRNDSAEGMASLTDTNQVLTLLTVAVMGNSRKVLEVTVMKWRFPQLPASLVLNGSPLMFSPSSPSAGISGVDASANGGDKNAVGVLTEGDRMTVLDSIPDLDEIQYPGIAVRNPPPADVGLIDTALDRRLRTPEGMERIVESIVAIATDLRSPGWNGTAVLGDMGSSSDYRVVVVNGDCELDTGVGYGLLLVRGNLRTRGSFHWNGLIVVIGQGTIGWAGAGIGVISGGVLVARTRADDRSPTNELGTILPSRGEVDVDFNGGGNRLQLDNPGSASLDLVNQKFPYMAISRREW